MEKERAKKATETGEPQKLNQPMKLSKPSKVEKPTQEQAEIRANIQRCESLIKQYEHAIAKETVNYISIPTIHDL